MVRFFFIFSTNTLLCCGWRSSWQSHYLSKAIEERGTQEVVDRNLAIEALKKEVKTLEAEKTRFVGEVGGLRIAHAELEEL